MSREFKITGAQHGAAFAVRVMTDGARLETIGVQDDGALHIQLTEPAVADRANDQLIVYLADLLAVDLDQLNIVAGHDQARKLISVNGLTPGEVEERLRRL